MMNDDDLISNWSAGHRHTFFFIAMAKRAVAMPGIGVNEQLKMLQQINDCTDLFVLPEMVAAIEPMSDLEFKMYSAAAALDGGEEKLSPSFGVVTSGKTFRAFCAVNPSYVVALRLGAEKAQTASNLPSAEEIEPQKRPPMRYSDQAATSVSPKSPPPLLVNRPPIAPVNRGPWCHDETWGQT